MTRTEFPHFLTDTHAHLSSTRFEGIVGDVIARAAKEGVERILSISCDLEDSQTNLELAKTYPGVFPTVGIHPLYVHELSAGNWRDEIRAFATNPSVAAIGEIGLDYFHPPRDGSTEREWREKQREVFEFLLQLAMDLDLPAVIHQRESAGDVMEVLRNFPEVTAVLHCFTGTVEEAEAALEMGHFLSFTGVLTFKGADGVRAAAAMTPLDRLMVETDAPYLAPAPFRGKQCEPAMMPHTARALGDLHGLSLDEIAEVTTRNAERFFRLFPPTA